MSKPIPPFNDIARSFDPMMPQAEYELIREKYFEDHVRPGIKNPTALPQVWEEFKKRTERPPLLSPVEKVGLHVERALVGAQKSLLAPFELLYPALKELPNPREAELDKIAAREGMSVIPKFVGEMAGTIPAGMVLAGAMGPAAGAVTSRAFQSAKAMQFSNRVLKGGLGFAAYEAMVENEGSRLMAGVKGFALGAGFESLLGLPALLKTRGLASTLEEADELAKKALAGEPVPEPVQQAVAAHVTTQAKAARAEGNPNLFLLESEKDKGVRTLIEMPDGKTAVVEILRANEDEAMNRISRLLEQGGAIDTFQWHPDDAGRASKFIRQLADSKNLKYDESLFIRTTQAQAPEALAKELVKEQIPAEVKGSTVAVPVKKIGPPKKKMTAAEKADADIEELRQRLETESKGVVEEAATEAKAIAEVQIEGSARRAIAQEPKLSREQAILIAKRIGADPLRADIDAIRYMGEEELTRLMEMVQKQRIATQEAARKGVPPKSQAQYIETSTASKPTSPNEPMEQRILSQVGYDYNTHKLISINFEGRPGQVRAIVPNEVMNKIGKPDAFAVTFAEWQEGMKAMGVPMKQIMETQAPDSPLILYKANAGRSAVYHEGLHANMVNSELTFVEEIPQHMRGLATELADGVKGMHSDYGSLSFEHALNEAFTYASQAIRFGDDELLETVAKWDKSPEHVIEFVHATANSLLRSSFGKLDNPGVRIFQRRLQDLIRRTDHNIFDAASKAGVYVEYNAKDEVWNLISEVGESRFKSLNSLWDAVNDADISDYGADPTFWAQVRGVRGPFTEGPPPRKQLPLPNFPLFKENSANLLGITGLFRPFLPWVSSLDSRVNRILERSGKFRSLPIYNAVRKVDDGIKLGDKWLIDWTKKFGDILKDWEHGKQKDLFELMTHDPSDWEKAAANLRLNPEQLLSARKMLDAAKEFSDDSGVNLITYWKNFYSQLKHAAWQPDGVKGWGILKKPNQQGFWERNITTGELDPSDAHMGRFLQWSMRKGYEKKFTGSALDDLQKIVDLKTDDGHYVLGPVRWPLTNYVKYVKGIPDNSAQMINRTVKDIQDKLVTQFKKINPSLPDYAKLPEDFNIPSTAINRLLLLSYTAGLALRPVVTVRDALQVFITGMPIIGPKSFGRGLQSMFTKQGREFAENSGALLHKHNIGELYGDIFQELPLDRKGKMAWLEKFSQKLLGPSRWGNNFARGVVYNGAYTDAVEAITKYQKGAITAEEFLEQSHLWFADSQRASQMLTRAKAETPGNLARDIAIETVETTQFPYRRGTQPAMLRTGLGRILGQYGTWPLNYLEFVAKLGYKHGDHKGPALRAMATWGAVNAVASASMESAGLESSQWLWTSPTGYTGGPTIQLLQDLSQGLGVTEEAKSARARVLRYPLNFVPAWIEMRSIMSAMEKEEDFSIGGKGFLRVMGFKPIEEVQSDQDYIEWALEESGITASPYRRR